MSGRRSRVRGRAKTNRSFPRDCYEGHSSDLDNRPAFDNTPFDSSSGGSAWDTLPAESIFDSTDCDSSEAPPPDASDWLSSPEHRNLMSFITSTPNLMPCDEEIALAPRVATPTGCGSTASPLLRRVLGRSNTSGLSPLDSTIATNTSFSSRPSESCSPFSSGLDSIMSSGLDSSGLPPGSSGLSRFADSSNSAGSPYSQFRDDSPEASDYEYAPMDITPTPWNPTLSSQRLEDPNNPPPMFHPLSNNEWRTDPTISQEVRNMYASSCSDYSGNHGIFNYGRLSEYNTQNLYNPEGFDGLNEQAYCTPVYEEGDCSEVFGDPHEALSRPTDEVPDKYRKEKWHYFELKKRLELFKQLGMEGDLAMYEGQLERMEADPWTGDDSGGEVEAYIRGTEGDPGLDEQMERMEALVAPENEGRMAFFAAMENPPLPYDPDLELMEALVAPENEGRMAFFAAMANPPPWNEEDSYLMSGAFQHCIVGDDTQLERLTSYTNEGRRAFERAMENPPPPIRDECPDMVDDGLERMEQLVSPINEQRRAFYAAMENPQSNVTENYNDSFQTCSGGDDLEALVSPRNRSRRAFFEVMQANRSSCGMENSNLDGTFQTCHDEDDSQMADSNLNESFTLPEGYSYDFPPDVGPDGC